MPAPTAPDTLVCSVSTSEVRSVFLGVDPKKVTGLDGVPGRALRSCADQLAEAFADIFNLSLLQVKVPTCFEKTIIIPIPKKTHAECLNDYCPIAPTSIIMKCFKGLVVAHINFSLPTRLDPLQLAYRQNRKTKELIINFRKKGEQSPIYINSEVESVKSIKFPGVTITNDLFWTSHVNATVKKAQQHLFFLRQLRKFG
eukprot:g23174.t1